MEGGRRPLRRCVAARMSGGLLARVCAGGVGAAGEDPAASIAAHLGVLLRARQGSSPASPGFGLADITDAIHSYPAGAAQIGARIRSAIEAFEPRLADGVAVDLLVDHDAPLHLNYRVMARLAEDRRRLLVFRADVAPSGEITVELE